MGTENMMPGQAEKKPFAGVVNHFQGDGENYPGWQELVALANASGNATVWTGAVYKGDVFACELGSNPFIKHVPGENHGVDPDDLISAYACLKISGSIYPIIEVFSRAKILSHQDKFVPKDAAHYSYSFFEAYARKLPLLEVLKYVKKSPDLNSYLASDAEAEGLPWARKAGKDAGSSPQAKEAKEAKGPVEGGSSSVPDPYECFAGDGALNSTLPFVSPDTPEMGASDEEWGNLL